MVWGIRQKKTSKYPFKFGLITLTKESKENGIDDDYNRIITIYKNEKPIEILSYSEDMVRTLIDDEEIPIVDEREISEFEEFDFLKVEGFGEVSIKR